MKAQIKIITHAVDRDADRNTAMWFVKLNDELSDLWNKDAYWTGWVEAEVARALGFDWLDSLKAGHQLEVYRMAETLFAVSLTRPIEGS